jgi:hypothetical protein
MINKKIILLCGYSRGGTNIAWNILQSHPEICSAIDETHNLINNKKFKIRTKLALFRRLNLVDNSIFKRLIDYELYKIKMANYVHVANKYRYPSIKYTRKQVKESAICLKSVDKAIEHTDFLLTLYPDLFFIALARNGYALLDGHIRRGASVKESALLYQSVADKMKYYSEKLNNYKLIKFEDILAHPFNISIELFKFTDSNPFYLDHLRIKSKKIITMEGNHEVMYGDEQNKYWFDKESINTIFDIRINERQIKNLKAEQIKEFNKFAKSAMEYFSYDILN